MRQESSKPYLYWEVGPLSSPNLLGSYSREVLCRAYHQHFQSPLTATDIAGHHFLKDSPQVLASLAHSFDSSSHLGISAIALANRSDFASVGVDVEVSSRQLPPGWQRHVLSDEEGQAQLEEQLSALQIWCAKEAAFKALWPLCQIKVLKELSITRFESESMAMSFTFANAPKGRVQIQSTSSLAGDLCLALAWIDHSS